MIRRPPRSTQSRSSAASDVYKRQKIIRKGLQGAAERLNTIKPELATQFLDVPFKAANFTDRFLLSAWGTLTPRLRPLLTETVIRSLAGSDFTPKELMFSEKPITVYLRWKEQDLLALSPLIRLMWGSLIGELTTTYDLSLIHISEPTRLGMISYAVFCLKKK